MFEAPERVLRFAMTERGGPDHEIAVGYSFGNALELSCLGQQRRSAHGRARLAERRLIRIYHAQAAEAQVAHSTSRRTEVEWVARRNQHDAQIFELSGEEQTTFYNFKVA